MSAVGENMGFSTTDWVALFIFGVSALVGTFGKRLVRIIGLAVMPFAFAGLILSLSHHGTTQGQGPITNDAPNINTDNTNNTNTQSGGTNILEIVGPQRLLFDVTIADQLASKLPTNKSIEILAVGSRTDWNVANQYAQYLKTKGFAVSFTRSSETVPPLDHKITIRDDPTTSPIFVIIAPSAV
jgi:energy-coupling factor transporter transmembrane protein EcfT